MMRKKEKEKKKEVPEMHQLLEARDYTGAITLSDFERKVDSDKKRASGWRAGAGGEYEWVEGGSSAMTGEEAKQDETRMLWKAYAAFHLGGERPQLRLADRPELSTLDFFRPPSAAAGPAEECQGESMRTVRILAPRSAAARAAALGEPRVRMAGRRARALRV